MNDIFNEDSFFLFLGHCVGILYLPLKSLFRCM